MSLFKKVEDDPPITGIDVLRDTLKIWSSKPGVLRALARDIDGIGISQLEDFAAGKLASFPPPIMRRLAEEIFGGFAVFDPETDMLRPVAREPAKAFVRTEPFDPTNCPQVVRVDRNRIGPQPVKASPVKTTTQRAGWLGSFPARPLPQAVIRAKPREPFVRARAAE